MKAVVMVSGGLDSILAVKVLEEQGIEVVPINFDMGFSQAGHKKIVPSKHPSLSGIDILKEMGYPVVKVDVTADYFKDVLIAPKHGYGKAMNPCIDCKIFFEKKAWEYAQSIGAKFIATGEVIDQRPMSQRMHQMKNIEAEAGVAGMVVRPLSALQLPVSIPEQNGWVDRARLCGIQGRGRREQMALAKKYGIDRYESPAGGCFLAEKEFALRFRDLLSDQEKMDVDYRVALLLKIGRHFRLSPTARLVLGRNFHENRYLESMFADLKRDFLIIDAENNPGPLAILVGDGREDALELAKSIVSLYARKEKSVPVKVLDRNWNSISDEIVEPIEEEEMMKYRIELK